MTEKVIAALVRTLLPQLSEHTFTGDDPHFIKVSQALFRKIKGMPIVLHCAMTVLLHVFNIWGLITAGRLFCAQDTSARLRQVGQWQRSPVGLCREFIGFFEKMTAFIHFSLCPNKI